MIQLLNQMESEVHLSLELNILYFEKHKQKELNDKFRGKRVELNYGTESNPKLLCAEIVNCDVTIDVKFGTDVKFIVYNGRDIPFKVGINGIKRFL